MSLLSFTVKKARFVGSLASQWSCYATLKLQSVKSTTVVVKGSNPSWEQDFLFELNNLDVGLLIEVWNKGRFWDNVIGYHYLYLSDIHCSNVAGAGQWLSLDAELVMRDGEVVGTKSPTGHVLLVDARFELPLGDVEGDEAVELQWKLEMLNSMLDQEARAEQSRRQQQYYVQSGVSEDSDYTSDVNYPVGQHPNSSASQYLSAANSQFSRSLNSSRENSYEKDDDQQRNKESVYLTPPRTQKSRLLPNIYPEGQGFDTNNDSRNYETDPLYYNSRPHPQKPPYKPSYRADSFENGYDYSRPPEDDYGEEYHDANEDFPTTLHQVPIRQIPSRRKASSLDRQDTMMYGDEGPEDYGGTKGLGSTEDGSRIPAYPVSTTSDCDQYSTLHQRSSASAHQSQIQNPQNAYNLSQTESFYDPEQFDSNYVGEKYDLGTPAFDYGDNVRNTTSATNIASQKSYPYDEGWYRTDSRDHYAAPVTVHNTGTEYSQHHPFTPTTSNQQNQSQQSQSKPSFQQQFGLSNLKKTIASVFPSISTQPSSSSTMLKPQVNASIPINSNVYSAGTGASNSTAFPAHPLPGANQVVPQKPAPSLASNQFQQEERFDFENWDFTNGYYDESGNFVPYQGYYDESGNFVPTETAPGMDDSYEYYDTHSGHPGDSRHSQFDNTHKYSTGSHDVNLKGTVPIHQLQPQYSEDYSLHEDMEGYDPYYYDQEEVEYPDTRKLTPGKDSSAFHAPQPVRQPSIQSQGSVDYNYAYESTENLPSAFDKTQKQGVIPKKESSLDRANSVVRRQSFRRQASTRDYGLEGGPENQGQGPLSKVTKGNYPNYNKETPSVHHSLSLDDSHYDDGWTSQEYADADGGTIRTNSYDHYEDAVEEQEEAEGITSEGGPVHMDSLESNTSDPGQRDRDANEKFEAQYWQRQRERIAEQATFCSQDSQEYYDYEPYEGPSSNQHPQRLESIDESPFTPPATSLNGDKAAQLARQGSETEWMNGTRSGRSSLDQPTDWVTRQGSLKIAKKEVKRELSRQETLEGQLDVADEEYLGEYDEDEMGHPFMRKHSSVSVDSLGETLPPTSPPPSSEHKSESQQLSMEDESVTERKASLDIQGKDKGAKSVSFEPEPPKSLVPERHTKGMTSKEKWLWSMNRICSTLQVSVI